jgi:hypothetical protein
LRLKIISCEVLARELYHCAATSPHVIDIHLVQRGLHNTPDVLREEIQRQVDAASATTADAICLGYGLCGNALAGVTARSVQLVLPRAHDCITLYLGSRARYQQEFTNHPGTYYYAMDYIERREGQDSSLASLGAVSDTRRKEVYEEYVQKYGKDNADYLLEVMGGWAAHYDRAAFIDVGVGDSSAIEASARQDAQSKGWTFDRLAGSLVLLRKLAYAEWDDDFLIVPPGQQIVVSYDHNVVGCQTAATGGPAR